MTFNVLRACFNDLTELCGYWASKLPSANSARELKNACLRVDGVIRELESLQEQRVVAARKDLESLTAYAAGENKKLLKALDDTRILLEQERQNHTDTRHKLFYAVDSNENYRQKFTDLNAELEIYRRSASASEFKGLQTTVDEKDRRIQQQAEYISGLQSVNAKQKKDVARLNDKVKQLQAALVTLRSTYNNGGGTLTPTGVASYQDTISLQGELVRAKQVALNYQKAAKDFFEWVDRG